MRLKWNTMKVKWSYCFHFTDWETEVPHRCPSRAWNQICLISKLVLLPPLQDASQHAKKGGKGDCPGSRMEGRTII